MRATIPYLRALFHELEAYEGVHAYEEVLLPWLPRAQKAMATLSRYGDLAAMAWRRDDPISAGVTTATTTVAWSTSTRSRG